MARAEETGFDVILQTSRNSDDDLQKCLTRIRQKMIKGIIMLSAPADETFYEKLDECAVPVVVIGKVAGNYQHISSVDTDNYHDSGNDSNLLIVFYVQIMPDDFVMQLHRF